MAEEDKKIWNVKNKQLEVQLKQKDPQKRLQSPPLITPVSKNASALYSQVDGVRDDPLIPVLKTIPCPSNSPEELEVLQNDKKWKGQT